jgi:hypothetical protein
MPAKPAGGLPANRGSIVERLADGVQPIESDHDRLRYELDADPRRMRADEVAALAERIQGHFPGPWNPADTELALRLAERRLGGGER